MSPIIATTAFLVLAQAPGATSTFVGVFLPAQAADVTSEVGGTIQQVHVKMGDSVEAGAPLVSLDGQRVRFEHDAAVAELRAQELAHKIAATDRESADGHVAAAERLKDSGWVSKQEWADTQARTTRARFSERAAVAAIAQKRAQVQNLEHQRVAMDLRAPFSGTLVYVSAEPGAAVSPGRRLARIVSRGDLLVRFAFPEEEMTRLGVGQAIEARDERGETVLRGTVERISPVILGATRMAIAEASLSSQQGMPLAGSLARVSVVEEAR